MNIFIVAVDHGIQLKKETSDPPQLTAQKEQLETLLHQEISKRKVQFISEESDPQKATIARALARDAKPQIPWINIKMNDEERAAAGIKDALAKRPGHPDYETMSFWIESRIPEDIVRESFFIDQTLHAAKDAGSILMLLGDLHVDAVAKRLIERGHRVETNHDLFPVRRWEEMPNM
jgi:hypothetical protein